MAELALESVPGWLPAQVQRLAAAWITSAEQVVAVSVTSGGLRSLAEQLETSDDEAQRLVHLARAALSPTARADMSQRADTDERGLGARPPGKETDDDPAAGNNGGG